MIKHTTIALLLAVAPVAAADFELKSASPLSLSWRGTPLISAEMALPEFAPKPAVTRVDVAGWEAIHHVWRADDKSKTRIEAAVSADTFELTLVRLIVANITGVVRYGFTVPHEFLDGRKVEIIADPESTKGTAASKGLTAGMLGPKGVKTANLLSYLRVHHPAGDLDFDFNPRGWWTSAKTMTSHAAEWQMQRTVEGYVFTTAFSRTLAGTLQEFKLVIRGADKRPVIDVHPRTPTRWTDGYRNILRLIPGAARIKGFTNHTVDAGENAPARWLDPAAVRIERDERFAQTAPTRLEGASPRDPKAGAALQLRVPRDGHYMVNLLVGAPDRSIGPCDLWTDENKKRQMPRVAAGDYDTWTIVARAVNAQITLRFGGDFRVAAIGVAPMLYDNEDYLFQRGWWLSPQRHPDDTLPD